MSMPIGPIRPVPLAEPAISPTGKEKAGDFGAMLDNTISELEQSRQTAQQQAERFLGGKSEELHSVVLSTQRAQLEFELFMEVRNRVVQAYQEIMRMQV